MSAVLLCKFEKPSGILKLVAGVKFEKPFGILKLVGGVKFKNP